MQRTLTRLVCLVATLAAGAIGAAEIAWLDVPLAHASDDAHERTVVLGAERPYGSAAGGMLDAGAWSMRVTPGCPFVSTPAGAVIILR